MLQVFLCDICPLLQKILVGNYCSLAGGDYKKNTGNCLHMSIWLLELQLFLKTFLEKAVKAKKDRHKAIAMSTLKRKMQRKIIK